MKKTIVLGEFDNDELEALVLFLQDEGIEIIESDDEKGLVDVSTPLEVEELEELLYDNGFDCDGIRA